MTEYRIRWAKVTGPWKSGRRRMCIAEKRVNFLWLFPIWCPLEHGEWRHSEFECQRDIKYDIEFSRALPLPALNSLDLTENQQQAQAALDRVMNCRFSNFDAGAVIHWAERGLYQVKTGSAPASNSPCGEDRQDDINDISREASGWRPDNKSPVETETQVPGGNMAGFNPRLPTPSSQRGEAET